MLTQANFANRDSSPAAFGLAAEDKSLPQTCGKLIVLQRLLAAQRRLSAPVPSQG
jgi:hypothetical protein